MEGGTTEAHRRFDITLENANAVWRATRDMSNRFTPLGVIQGWSPGSMAEAARRLVAMGYNYLAVGGTVPLKSPQIRSEEHTSELQSLMRSSYAVFCLQKKNKHNNSKRN